MAWALLIGCWLGTVGQAGAQGTCPPGSLPNAATGGCTSLGGVSSDPAIQIFTAAGTATLTASAIERGREFASYRGTRPSLVFILALLGFFDDDPAFDIEGDKTSGVRFRTVSGAAGFAPNSSGLSVGGSAHGAITPRQIFRLGDYESLALGAYVNGMTTDRDYGAALFKDRSSLITIAAFARYAVHDTVVALMAGGGFGSGTFTDQVFAARGNYSRGETLALAGIAHTFHLYADPRGNRLDLLPGIVGGYVTTDASSFTDSLGYRYGENRMSYWSVTPKVDLAYTVPDGERTWRPFVGAFVENRLGYSNKLDLIAQPTQIAAGFVRGGPADVVRFNDGTTFWGVRGGAEVRDRSGITVGATASYQKSSTASITGGQAYVRFPIVGWLSGATTPFAPADYR